MFTAVTLDCSLKRSLFSVSMSLGSSLAWSYSSDNLGVTFSKNLELSSSCELAPLGASHLSSATTSTALSSLPTWFISLKQRQQKTVLIHPVFSMKRVLSFSLLESFSSSTILCYDSSSSKFFSKIARNRLSRIMCPKIIKAMKKPTAPQLVHLVKLYMKLGQLSPMITWKTVFRPMRK